MACFYRIFTSGHNFFRKCALMLLTIYSEHLSSLLSLSLVILLAFFLIDSSITSADM